MAYVFVTSACFCCKRLFSYNPNHVPSIPIKDGKADPRGTREPLCQACVDRVNPERIKRGLAPIVPHAEAYEPCDENEVNWNGGA